METIIDLGDQLIRSFLNRIKKKNRKVYKIWYYKISYVFPNWIRVTLQFSNFTVMILGDSCLGESFFSGLIWLGSYHFGGVNSYRFTGSRSQYWYTGKATEIQVNENLDRLGLRLVLYHVSSRVTLYWYCWN